MTKARVLVVDDDDGIVDSLRRGLELEGYSVVTAADGTDALRAVEADRLDAVVLDVGLPDLNGRIVAARMRAGGLETLEAGADDYLVKPFAMDELTARLRALLRRAAYHSEQARGVDPPLRLGRLLIDSHAAVASWDGRDLCLTRRELTLLETLARNPGVTLSRDRLLELVWGYDFAPESRALDVFISYLRRKLDTAGAPRILETVRGVGYVLRRP